jgi:3-deoxy-D-manno-octulosonic acid kinase
MSRAEIRARGNTITIHDPARSPDFSERWFDRDWWTAQGARSHSITGRAGVLMLDRGEETWVYRHYHRGGLVSHLSYDQYVWTGVERSRPVREWRLLEALSTQSLPAPRPVAARAVRTGPIYRADILTVLLPDTVPLSSLLGEVWDDADLWAAIGAMVAGFHRAGCDHPDLTAHNILVDSQRRPYLVDFDNARFRSAGAWMQAGIARLKRSLNKVSHETGTQFSEPAWQQLVAAYTASQRSF